MMPLRLFYEVGILGVSRFRENRPLEVELQPGR
jgi:hypothetical protein